MTAIFSGCSCEDLKRWCRLCQVEDVRDMRSLDFKQMERMLAELQSEEEMLPRTIEVKGKALCEMNRENVRKEELVRKLKRKLARRQENRVAIPRSGQQGRTGYVDEGRGRDAAELFPEEVQKNILGYDSIWNKIFEEITDPQDLWNCYNTCALFRKILHPWKTTWAFEQALPYLFPHLPGEKLLECRLVSHGWKETVDQFLLNHPSLLPHNEESCNPRTLPFVSPQEEKELCTDVELEFRDGMLPNLEDEDYLNEVRTKLSVWHGARVSIASNKEEGVNEQVWINFYTFFRNFGELVWDMHLDVGPSDDNHLVEQKVIQFLKEDLIGLAPNLRKLRLGEGPAVLIQGNVDVEWTVPYPFLETLEVENCAVYLVTLFNFTRIQHAKLKKLSLERLIWTHLPTSNWPYLTELNLNIVADRFTRLELESLLLVSLPNLSKLGLESSNEHLYGYGFRRFLEILGELSRTTRLRALRLVLLMGRTSHNVLLKQQPFPSPELLSDLPRLTTLELEFRSGRTVPRPSLQFLLYFPHVENLHVFWSKPSAAAKGKTSLLSKDELGLNGDVPGPREMEVVEVNRYMYSGEMYRSNIWELLPRLKVFSFQWDIYTRGEYEEHRRRRAE